MAPAGVHTYCNGRTFRTGLLTLLVVSLLLAVIRSTSHPLRHRESWYVYYGQRVSSGGSTPAKKVQSYIADEYEAKLFAGSYLNGPASRTRPNGFESTGPSHTIASDISTSHPLPTRTASSSFKIVPARQRPSKIKHVTPLAYPTQLTAETLEYPTGLDLAAHMIPDADRFWVNHFPAVLNQPNVKMRDAKSTCRWPRGVDPVFMYYEGLEWVQNDLDDMAIAEARSRWQEFVRRGFYLNWAETKGNFTKGRGIVIVGGKANTIKRMKLQLKVLNAYGCTLPVEIHHWSDEIDEGKKWELTQEYANLTTNDLSRPDQLIASNPPYMNGYHLKINAVLNSRFDEVLLLDSDNIPLFNPADLFETAKYKEFGTVFWPDVMRTRPNNPMWATTNTHCRMDEYEQESGQMLVDKRRFFYHLQLSSFFISDTFESSYLLGDKDMFRFAWHALKTRYGTPARWIATLGTRLAQTEFFCGRSFAQHHPDTNNGSIAFLHLNAMKNMHLNVFDYYRAHGGLFSWYKGPPQPANWSAVVWAGHKGEETPFLAEQPNRTSVCVDFYDEQEIPTSQVLPDFEGWFAGIGAYDDLAETVGR